MLFIFLVLSILKKTISKLNYKNVVINQWGVDAYYIITYNNVYLQI